MTYQQNLSKSAHRHFQAAELLYADMTVHRKHKPVAGYLYGIAGELAVKKLMQKSGIKELDKKERRSDPYYKHFPELKTLIFNHLGCYYRRIEKIETALSYYEKSLEIIKKLDKKKNSGLTHMNLSAIYSQIQRFLMVF